MLNMSMIIGEGGIPPNVLTLSDALTAPSTQEYWLIGNRSQGGQTINCTVEFLSAISGDLGTITVRVRTYTSNLTVIDHDVTLSELGSTTFDLDDTNFYTGSNEYYVDINIISTQNHPNDQAQVKITVNSATIDTLPSPDNDTVTLQGTR